MLSSYLQRLFADPNGAPALVRRLLVEQAAGQWRRYALAFGMMFIAAASTALGTYLIGDVINAAYVDKNLPANGYLSGPRLADDFSRCGVEITRHGHAVGGRHL